MNGIKFVKYGAVVAAAVLVAATAKVNAMTVTWGSASTETAVALNGGVLAVPQGDLVEIGVFKNNMSDAAITALGVNPTAIQTAFNAWSTDTVGDSTTSAGAWGDPSSALGAGYFTSNAFIVVFNAATAGAATQVAVIKGPATASVGDNWVFPASDGASGLTFVFDALSAGNVLIGSFESGTFDDSAKDDYFGSGANAVVLAAVPEPSTYMLVGSGLLGLLALRRRRS